MSPGTTPPIDGNRTHPLPDGRAEPTFDRETVQPPPVAPPRRRSWWRRIMVEQNERTSGWLSSMLFHTTVLLLLALVVHSQTPPDVAPHLTSWRAEDVPSPEELPSVAGQWSDPTPVVMAQSAALELPPTQIELEVPHTESAELSPFDEALDATETSDLGGSQWTLLLAGRSPEARAELVRRRGGTHASEAAVERGLQWLAAHQLGDGSWNYNHTLSRCRGQCRNPGSVTTTTGATAMALLAFLGAGHTHLEGEYADVVRRGLYHLARRTNHVPQGADLQEGTMYAQGLAAIVLCEASAMTQDESLQKLAQEAIDFIAYAQDDTGGGWRYFPNDIGDTSVTGWQLMALKSGQLAGLEVPRSCFYGANHFLDSVAARNGQRYGYQTPSEDRPTMTSVGLLCRMYLGWRRDDPRLEQGIAYLHDLGPSRTDLYFDYYATQVLSHYGGPLWESWNPAMRDYLVATQGAQGHESGSWFFVDEHATSAGRLYNTAMAIMILEVYYRYLPLYKDKAVDEDP